MQVVNNSKNVPKRMISGAGESGKERNPLVLVLSMQNY